MSITQLETPTSDRVLRLEEFKMKLLDWDGNRQTGTRTYLNQNLSWVRREAIEASCFKTLTIYPPPIVGGLIMRGVDPLSMLFNAPYGESMVNTVVDMIDQTIGVLKAGPPAALSSSVAAQVDVEIRKGYVFVAMPMKPGDPHLDDVLDAVKEAADRCGLNAERVDEPESNERITDRILESIRIAEFVIVDLTGARPNVFYEAGYAQGIGKIPIYTAVDGTPLEFDLKDYPVIFFKGMKDLKDSLERRLRGLAESKAR